MRFTGREGLFICVPDTIAFNLQIRAIRTARFLVAEEVPKD
jgi:hypothetical protein